ncbi:MAG: glucose-6-phosphate dehydrogenase [Elusimicrobiota bacterium]
MIDRPETALQSAILASKIYTKQELCLLEQIPEPCGIIIFGASGDLAHRKLLPSLFRLSLAGLMPKQFYVLGVARTGMTNESFRQKIKESLPEEAISPAMQKFLDRCYYAAGDYSSPSLYQSLKNAISDLDKKYSIEGRRVFYLSTPPSLYSDIVSQLGASKLAYASSDHEKCWTRVIIEKPFGTSLTSAIKLNSEIKNFLTEKQIYRIDHYLAKETVQNILMFRFANIIFEPIWNRNYIDHIQITASEQLGVEHRAGYYEQAGVIRDMFQNHLLQLMALIAMEPPTSLEADAVRSKRSDVLDSIKQLRSLELLDDVICGQYGHGTMNGKKVIGYREEEGVHSLSRVPTFAAIKFEIDNWRWQGIPFFIRCGKRMSERLVEIAVHFKHVPTSIFKPLLADQLSPNVLKFRIQPDEGITMNFEAKHPGPKLCMSTVTMNFGYKDTFKTPMPESYARLFQDSMLGDQTLFARTDGVEQSWRIVDPIIESWENDDRSIPIYPAGSWGPIESQKLMERYGRSWDQ